MRGEEKKCFCSSNCRFIHPIAWTYWPNHHKLDRINYVFFLNNLTMNRRMPDHRGFDDLIFVWVFQIEQQPKLDYEHDLLHLHVVLHHSIRKDKYYTNQWRWLTTREVWTMQMRRTKTKQKIINCCRNEFIIYFSYINE
jgi:hypothetical protein